MNGSASFAAKTRSTLSMAGWFVAGVLLPVAAFGIELATKMCAEELFDPLWTSAHVVLVATVPAVHAWLWLWSLRHDVLPRAAGPAVGFALAVSLYYALIFLPLTPLAVVAVLYLGLGLLPLAPLLSAVAGMLLWGLLRKQGISRRSLAAGWLAGVLVLVAAELPAFAHVVWTDWATAEDPATRQRGLALLRSWGDRDALLEACYWYWQSALGRSPAPWVAYTLSESLAAAE